ncbi:MAG: hypothetical protein JJV97_06180 [SAR324 cluster bacterium]|nr:hypothetical protein [SAR324 cluster bacterium]
MDLISLIGGVYGALGEASKVIDGFVTTSDEKHEFKIELMQAANAHQLAMAKLVAQNSLSQINTNQTEAKHANLFVAGWRPAVGWLAVITFGYSTLIYPFLVLIWPNLPAVSSDILLNLLFGLLGLGGMRTYEKLKNVTQRH